MAAETTRADVATDDKPRARRDADRTRHTCDLSKLVEGWLDVFSITTARSINRSRRMRLEAALDWCDLLKAERDEYRQRIAELEHGVPS